VDEGFLERFLGGQVQIRTKDGVLRELGTISRLGWAGPLPKAVILRAFLDSAWELIDGKWWPSPSKSIVISRLQVRANMLIGIRGFCKERDAEREGALIFEKGHSRIVPTPEETVSPLEDLFKVFSRLSACSFCDLEAGTVTISVVEIGNGERYFQRWQIDPIVFDFSFKDVLSFKVVSIERFEDGSYGIFCLVKPMDSGSARSQRSISGTGDTIEAAIQAMLHPV